MPSQRTGDGVAGVAWEDLPTQGADILIDTRKVSSRIKWMEGFRGRWHTANFRAPADATPGYLDKVARVAMARWAAHMESQGWALDSTPTMYGPAPATSESGLALPGWSEYTLRAVWRYTKTPKRIRTEVPEALRKQAPDHEARPGSKEFREVVRGMQKG